MAMYTALQIADYVINRCTLDGHPVSYFRLQELLYCIRREFLRAGKDIFGESIEAGPCGPVVRSVHNRYCAFASRGILLRCETSVLPQDAVIINQIIAEYGNLPPWDMADLIKPDGGAWDTVYDNGRGRFRAIPPSLIAAER